MAKYDRGSLANRFDVAWTGLESDLKRRWRERNGETWGQHQSAFNLLAWAREQQLLTVDQERFLDRCRSVRNAYAHVSFPGYSGPIASPPKEVVERLEKIQAGLQHPRKVSELANNALTCSSSTPLREALQTMHRDDFSQLPYRDEQRGPGARCDDLPVARLALDG